MQIKKLRKHPHRIILCPECHERIAERVRKRKKLQSLKRHPEG
ncbi:MAG: YlaI family protein [Planifilum fulgidum]